MAQTEVLLTKQPAPQTVPACELPRKEYEVARNTGAYSSSGLATAGFRTAKYLVDEWFQAGYARYHQAFSDRDRSERQRQESGQLAAETEALAQRTQQDSTRRVGQRLQDAHGWMSELQREVTELLAETDLLLAQKQRLERALDATALPFSITTDNLQSRERRQAPDLVRDRVEVELLKVRRFPGPARRGQPATPQAPAGSPSAASLSHTMGLTRRWGSQEPRGALGRRGATPFPQPSRKLPPTPQQPHWPRAGVQQKSWSSQAVPGSGWGSPVLRRGLSQPHLTPRRPSSSGTSRSC